MSGRGTELPLAVDELREVVGEKMRELMSASAQYAFSEDRLTDQTHVTPDGRGVDRTSLFEGLAITCAHACIALDDFDFLFEDLYADYDAWGIARIFLEQLELHQFPACSLKTTADLFSSQVQKSRWSPDAPLT